MHRLPASLRFLKARERQPVAALLVVLAAAAASFAGNGVHAQRTTGSERPASFRDRDDSLIHDPSVPRVERSGLRKLQAELDGRRLAPLPVVLTQSAPADPNDPVRETEADWPFAQQPVTNTVCPVMPDREVDENSIVVEYRGKEVRLCCKKCKPKFLEDPEKYLPLLPQFAGEASLAGSPANGASPKAASGGGPGASKGFRVGRLHVVFVHFPIAFLALAVLLELLALARRASLYGAAVRPVVIVAALSAIVATLLGLALEEESEFSGPSAAVFERHESFGIATAILAVLALVAGEIVRRKPQSGMRGIYVLLLLAASVAMGVAGHAGGLLVHGLDWFGF